MFCFALTLMLDSILVLTRIRSRVPALLAGRPGVAARSEEERNIRNLLLNGAWFGFIDGGILNYLPVYLARLGASASVLSLLTSGPSLLGILSYVPGGAYAERHGDQVKLVVRAALLIRLSYLAIALLPFFLSPAYIPLAAVILWSLISVPNAVHIPAWTTVMQKAVSPKRRAHLNGMRWSLYSLVSAGALALFGYWLDRSPFPLGYQAVFLVSFLAGMLGLYYFGKLIVSPFVPERAAQGGAAPGDRLRAFIRPFVECRDFLRYNMATLAFRLVLNMPAALYSIYWVNELHATNTWIGLRGTAGYGALVIGYRLWGHAANRLGHRTLLFICGGTFALYPVLTALAPTAQWLLPAAVVWGISVSGIDIGMFDTLLAACPEGRQPSFSATANMLISAVAFVGPLLGAGLDQFLDIRTTLLIIGGLQLATIAFFGLLPSLEQEELQVAR